MSQIDLFGGAGAAPANSLEQASRGKTHETDGQGSCQKGELVAVGTREYRYHRGCGEFVWLASLDAGIAGPFYWHRVEEVLRG